MDAATLVVPDPGLQTGEVLAQAEQIVAQPVMVVAAPEAASGDAPPEALGLFEKCRRFFAGTKAPELKEDRIHVHWLSLAYMVVMSVFALQVFALQDLQTALTPSAQLSERVQSTLLVGVIIVAVFISDYAAPHARELAKLVALRGEIGLAWSLRFYALCVYGTDGYAVVTILYRSVAHLPASTPPPALGPFSGDWTEVLIRGTLIVFTGWMIHTVTQKQYPTSNTLARRGAEIMGGVLLSRLASQKAANVAMSTVADWFRAFTEAATRQPRFTLPPLPFVNDPRAAEQTQWNKLVTVIGNVEKHPAVLTPVMTVAPVVAAAVRPPTPPAPAPVVLRAMPPVQSDDFLTLIAGMVATVMAQGATTSPTPDQVAAAAQALGYAAPDQADIAAALARLTEDAAEVTPAPVAVGNGAPQMATSAPAATGVVRPKPQPGNKAFPKWVYDTAYTLMLNRTANEVVNLASLAEATGIPDIHLLAETLVQYRPKVIASLRRGERIENNIVYVNQGFYERQVTTA